VDVKISVVTINYNNAGSLKETIDSVVNQSYRNIEYIVIDGGSSDDSKEIIEQYTDRIAYWISEPDRGIFNAMNKGIKISTGDYLLFINSGDMLIDDSVIKDFVDNGLDKDLIYGDLLFVKGEAKREWCPKEELTFDVFFRESIPHPSTLIKRELFDKIGLYNENHNIVSDWEFFMLALGRHNCTYKKFKRLVAVFNEDGISSRSDNWEIMQKERLQVLNEHFPLFIKDYQRFEEAEREMKKIAYFINTRGLIKRFLKATKLGS
jgi:glycosyltransferase involved in cell wall biosynthesis